MCKSHCCAHTDICSLQCSRCYWCHQRPSLRKTTQMFTFSTVVFPIQVRPHTLTTVSNRHVSTFRAATAIMAVEVACLAGRWVCAAVLTGTAAFHELHVVRTLVICGKKIAQMLRVPLLSKCSKTWLLEAYPLFKRHNIAIKSYGKRFHSSIVGDCHQHRRTVWRTLRWFGKVRRWCRFQRRTHPADRFY